MMNKLKFTCPMCEESWEIEEPDTVGKILDASLCPECDYYFVDPILVKEKEESGKEGG
jgi:hypothetical protein